jgi:hypothetical protein
MNGIVVQRGVPEPAAPPKQSPADDWFGYDIQTLNYGVDVPAELAPNPYPAASSFAGVGRDSQHEGNRQERHTVLAFSEWLSVMGWPFNNIPRILGSVIIPKGDLIQQRPIGFSPEIVMGTPRGTEAVAYALPMGDARATFVNLENPLAKLGR